MCKAFSCLVNISAKVTWKFGVDSHTDLIKIAGYKDTTSDPLLLEFARVEITPNNGNYLAPDTWSLAVDEDITPVWFKDKHKNACFKAKDAWLKKLNDVVVKKEILNPLAIAPPKEVTEDHIQLLRVWASVRDSVRDSVGDSVRDSVWASVWASVRDSVRDSVGDSVWASVGDSVWASVGDSVGASVGDSVWVGVGASVGSMFQLPEWQYVDYKKLGMSKKQYPFESVVKLWEVGLVPSFDGTIWRLHGGKKADVLFSITAKELLGKI